MVTIYFECSDLLMINLIKDKNGKCWKSNSCDQWICSFNIINGIVVYRLTFTDKVFNQQKYNEVSTDNNNEFKGKTDLSSSTNNPNFKKKFFFKVPTDYEGNW